MTSTKAASSFATGPLAGKTVALIHPAWHSCGSHNVFVAQAEAYRSLGAKVLDLAITDFPGRTASKGYFAATEDLGTEARFFGGMPLGAVATPEFLRATNDWLHGDYAAMLIETARQSMLPDEVRDAPIDLIHCNHFFCMPVAVKLRGNRGCPVLLDTHDLQARQYALRNRDAWTLTPKATYETMLARELAQMRDADVLIHLNSEEAEAFGALLPEKRHALIFPALTPTPLGHGDDIIIVASSNYPNFLGMKWFLREVMPLLGDAPVRVVGNVHSMLSWRTPFLYRRYRPLFSGYTSDLAGAYARAKAILLPTTSGFGISIKTIEALSSGVPLVAMKQAFRGMGVDPASLQNVILAKDAATFAPAVRRLADLPPGGEESRATSDTRQLYERLFTPDAYQRALAALVAPLLGLCSAAKAAVKALP